MKRAFALGAGLIAAGALSTGWAIARRLTAPVTDRTYDLTIRGIKYERHEQQVVLDRTTQTTAEGIYNLWIENGGWVTLANDASNYGPDQIIRTITGTSPGLQLTTGDHASWSGIYYASPSDAGLDARDTTIVTPGGPCPAWRIDGNLSTWAIHIHGLGSTRAGTLRGVQVATELGYSSLVVTYRNTTEGPHVGTGRSTLGYTEASDVDEAIGYAIRRGAEKIVLFGWSMGGAIALQLAHQPSYQRLIAGLVLDSPVFNWAEVIKTNCQRAGLPRCAGTLAVPWLSCHSPARFVGLPSEMHIGDMDWTDHERRLNIPMLILHGNRDGSVPISTSKTMQRNHPDLVTLETFDAGHTLSWNSDPQGWRSAITTWLSKPREV